MTKTLSVFISSKMVEMKPEREAMLELIPTLGDETLRLQPWIFESDAPASDHSIRDVYLNALDQSELYLGLFWKDYGEWTIDEYYRAGQNGITRHLYVKNVDADQRDPRLVDFLNQQSDVRFGITPRWFTTLDDLRTQVTRSVNQWLMERQIAYHSATTAIIATIADDIPDLPRKLIGRDELIQDVTELLEDNERVLLRGFGGMGKTALAATIAANYLEEQDATHIIWIRAGLADADAIFEAIARAFDAQQEITNQPIDARTQIIRRLLSQKPALLVLDDAWNGNALSIVSKAIPRRMPLLVTSRQRFPLDTIIEIGELTATEALKLLRYHSKLKVDDDPNAIRLCQLLGNHAFALEIAGKTLKAYSMDISDLIDRIEKAPHDIQMPYGFGELGRTGIKSLLDASIDALSKDLHDTFVVFGGMFEPTVTPDLMARVRAQSAETTAHHLAELAVRGLVNERQQADIPYYRLHDLAYSYARTMFNSKAMKIQPIMEACRQFTLDHAHDLDYLDIEQSNILEAAENAYEHEQHDILLDIIGTLTVSGPFFAARGHSSQSLRLLETTVTIAEARDDRESAHYLLSKLGNTYADFLGDRERALEAYTRALHHAQALQLATREAILLTVIGKTKFHLQQPDAQATYERAEALARQIEDAGALAFVLHHRGYYEMNKPQPDNEAGRRLSEEAATVAAQLGALEIEFHSLVNMGGAQLELGDVEGALATHQRAYALAEKAENHPMIAYALQSIGEDQHRLGNRDEARKSFEKVLVLWQQLGGKAQIEALQEFLKQHDYPVPH